MNKIKKTIPEEIPPLHITVFDSIFQQQVDVLLNYTPEKYESWLNKNKIKDIDIKEFDFFNWNGWTSYYTDEENRIKCIIFLSKFQWTIKHQGTLIHEITHAIIKIWDRNKIAFNSDTQEFLAHSISNMYEDIAHKLLRK